MQWEKIGVAIEQTRNDRNGLNLMKSTQQCEVERDDGQSKERVINTRKQNKTKRNEIDEK